MNIQKYTTPNQSSRGGYKPCLIVWHIADGTFNGTVSWERNPQSQTSSHFVLGKNGEIAQLVPLTEAAWTQGKVNNPTHPLVKMRKNVNPNLYCISIECEGFWKDTKGKLTEKALKAAAELTKHIVSEVKRIYGVEIPVDREHMIGHYEINPVTRSHCPGELFQFDKLISLANGKTPDTAPQPPQNNNQQNSDDVYSVRVGTFRNLPNATALRQELAQRGYFVYTSTNIEKTIVYVGKFKTKQDAEPTMRDLIKKGYSDCYIERVSTK